MEEKACGNCKHGESLWVVTDASCYGTSARVLFIVCISKYGDHIGHVMIPEHQMCGTLWAHKGED